MLKAINTSNVGREHSMDSGLRRNDTVGEQALCPHFNNHSCSGALWNFHTRFGPAITLR